MDSRQDSIDDIVKILESLPPARRKVMEIVIDGLREAVDIEKTKVAELERVNNQVLHRARESEHIAMELKSDMKELESKLAQVEVKPCEYFAAQVADCLGFEDVPKLMGAYLSRACEVVRRVADLESAMMEIDASFDNQCDSVDGSIVARHVKVELRRLTDQRGEGVPSP